MKKYWPLVLITIAGLALRLYHNTGISLWHDEAFSALLIRYPWSEMMYRIGLDVHPPMYYIFLRFWHNIFGDSLWSLRGFSIFFSVALIPLAYAFVKRAFKNGRAALWAALLIAVNPFQTQFTTEARMYTMGAFFALLAAYFLVKALTAEREYGSYEKLNIPNMPQALTRKRTFLWNYLWFALCTAIIIYTHYYLLFTAVALGGYGLVHHLRLYGGNLKKYLSLFGSFVLIGLLFVPWLKIFLFQFRQVSADYWIPRMNIWSIPTTLWQMYGGIDFDISTRPHQLMVAAAAIFCLFFLFRFVRRTGTNGWLVLFNILAPFAGALAFLFLARLRGENTSVYLVRYFLFASTFFTIALAVWLESVRPKRWAQALLVVYCIANLGAFVHNWNSLDITHKPGMAGAARFIGANVERNHKLYVGSSFEFFNLKYYLHTAVGAFEPAGNIIGLTPLLYTGGATTVSSMPHYAGTALLTDADLLPSFNAARRGDTVWLLWTNGFGGSKPAVPATWTQVDEKGFAEVRPYVGTWVVVTEYKVN